MTTEISTSPYAWLLTDIDGRIETASRGARALLGAVYLARGDDLLMLFPLRRKVLLFDIQVALTGWPTQRIVVVKPLGMRELTVRYRVSRRLKAQGMGLFWQLDTAVADGYAECA